MVVSTDVFNKEFCFIDETRKRLKKSESGRKYSSDDITNMNSGLLKAGPNELSTKTRTLVVHEALHQAYVTGDLKNVC
jgi:hypothetical protein